MALQGELERALRASWSLGELAVYADHLQELGDPRGELIALDLAPSRDLAWRERRHALLEAWLGPELGPELAASAGRLVQHGVIHELRDGHHPPGLLESPLGVVVRGCSIRGRGDGAGRTEAVIRALERLAAHPRPWLVRLAIDHGGDRPCDPALRDRLIAATPNLLELYALGERLFDSFRHPSLRRLYVTPARQRPATGFRGIPDTGAEVTELTHPGYAVSWFARDQDLDVVRTFLEAIDTTADCNELDAIYGGLVDEHDSMPAVLVRLDEAGLIALDGPFASLTALGRGVLTGSVGTTPRRRPRAAPFGGKWVLWAAMAGARRSGGEPTAVGVALSHYNLLVACFERLPLDEDVREVIRTYLEFLGRAVGGDDEERFELDVDLPALLAALRALLTARRLADYGVECFRDVGDGGSWSYLEQLVELLAAARAATGRATFWVSWGW